MEETNTITRPFLDGESRRVFTQTLTCYFAFSSKVGDVEVVQKNVIPRMKVDDYILDYKEM